MPLVQEYDETAIVIKCPAAPFLITPAWLLRKDVIDQRQFEAAPDELVAFGSASRFELDWLVVSVTPDTIQLSTPRPEQTSPLRDAAVAMIRALDDVPLWSMGFNRSTHFSVGGRAQAHRVGDTLTPKSVWGDVLHLPGMLTLTTAASRQGRSAGRVNVRTEPSSQVPEGIFVEVNDHYDLYDLDAPVISRDQEVPPPPELSQVQFLDAGLAKRAYALRLLEEQWNPSDKRAREIFARVYSLSGSLP